MEHIMKRGSPARAHCLIRLRKLCTVVVREGHDMRDHLTTCDRAAQCAAMAFLVIALLLATGASSAAQERHTAPTSTEARAADNGGITLPPGFSDTVVSDNTWRGSY